MKKVVVIGGGTGSFTVLSGLKNYDLEITAVVNMVDDGGSTGLLRDELGVLPPGDVRQCLVALSNSSRMMRDLFNYRFEEGSLKGHSFGNFFLTALEKVTGNFESAVEEACNILSTKGRVLPVTYESVTLCADLGNGKTIKGESTIDKSALYKYKNKKLYLEPEAQLNPKVGSAIELADLIVIAPGSLYASLIPNFLVSGIKEALKGAQAKVLYICNLVNKPLESANYTLDDYVTELEEEMGRDIDLVLFNNKKPQNELLKKYASQNELPVGERRKENGYKLIQEDLLRDFPVSKKSGDELIDRSFIRHDPEKLGQAIFKILDNL